MGRRMGEGKREIRQWQFESVASVVSSGSCPLRLGGGGEGAINRVQYVKKGAQAPFEIYAMDKWNLKHRERIASINRS